jgi:MFS family permease
MSRGLTLLFAIAGGASVGNLYWAQPLLAPIAEDFGVSPGNAGLVITLTQIGYALGVFLIVPLGDSMDRKRIIPAVMLLAAVALAATALAPSSPVLLGLVALLGVASVTGQILAPLAGDLATSEQRGRVLGTVASGLMLGILIARAVSGLAPLKLLRELLCRTYLGSAILSWTTLCRAGPFAVRSSALHMAQTPRFDLYSSIEEASRSTEEFMSLPCTTLTCRWELFLRCP